MNKLLKYEALAVGRVLVPVWLGAFALCLLAAGINALQSALPAATHLTVVMILQVVVELLAALSFLAVPLVRLFEFHYFGFSLLAGAIKGKRKN